MIVGLTVHILLAIAVMASAVTSPAHAQDNANAMAICSRVVTVYQAAFATGDRAKVAA